MEIAVEIVSKHKPLASTLIFWLALSVPLVFGFGLAVLIAYSSELGGLCFKSECVQGFFNTFKFPIAIMGLALPLVAMVAAIHRSNEAALQIKITSDQYGEAISNNRFGNYLKHREGFEKLLDNFCSKANERSGFKMAMNTSSLYGRLFPDSGFNNVNWTGQCSAPRLRVSNSEAKKIMLQAAASQRDFDLMEFADSVSVVLRIFQIHYAPYKTIEVAPVDGGDVVRVHIPGQGSEVSAMVRAASDCLNVLALFRSYVGSNEFDDLLIGVHFDNLKANLKEAESRMKSVE